MTIQMHTKKQNHHTEREMQAPDMPLGNIFDPTFVAAMANQLYADMPGSSHEAEGAAHQAMPGGGGGPEGTIPRSDSDLYHSLAALSQETMAPPLYQAGHPTTPPTSPSSQSDFYFMPEMGQQSMSALQGVMSGTTLDLEAINQIAAQSLAYIPPLFSDQANGTFPAEGMKAASSMGLTPFLSPMEGESGRMGESASGGEATPPTESQSQFYFLPETPNTLGMQPEGFDVNVIRKDFPALHQTVHGKPLIWLDNGATTQKPQSVIDTLAHFYQHDNSNIHRAAHALAARSSDGYEEARRKVQRFLGASSASEIVFVRGTTEAINLVAQSYGRKQIQAGDEIILPTLEHHANIVPWQMLAQEKGAIIRVVPITNQGEVILTEYARLLGPRTKIVALSQVSNVLGTVLPVQEMTQMAHRYGATVLIDGAQAVSHIPVNVQQLGCDFYVFSGHKLFAPTGIGALYGRKQLLEEMPPWQGGGNMIRHVTFEQTTYNDVPAKFEAGTPNIADAIGLGAAIDYVTRIGMETIAQYEHKLTQYGMECLAQVPGIRLIGTAPGKTCVLSFVFDDMRPEDVGRYLDSEGIAVRAGHHCAQPTMQHYGVTGTVRPSLALYNTYQEIDALVAALHKLRTA